MCKIVELEWLYYPENTPAVEAVYLISQKGCELSSRAKWINGKWWWGYGGKDDSPNSWEVEPDVIVAFAAVPKGISRA